MAIDPRISGACPSRAQAWAPPRGIRLRHLAWLALVYLAPVWWVHHLVREPFNLDYFRRYVSARCTDAAFARRGPAASREQLAARGEALRACQELQVSIDGVWGGLYGKPAVRLRVLSNGGATTELEYYSVDVRPLSGIASIAYEITPSLYYLTF